MTIRSNRIEKQILQELTVIIRAVKDPELSGFITLTDVKMSKNLKVAQVFYSILGTQDDKAGTARALDRAKGFMRRILAEKITIKRMPDLSFTYDPTPEHADKIERLLNKIEQEREADTHEQPQGPAAPGGAGDTQS